MTLLTLRLHNSTVDYNVSMCSDSKLRDKGQTKRKLVVALVVPLVMEARKVEPRLQKKTEEYLQMGG